MAEKESNIEPIGAIEYKPTQTVESTSHSLSLDQLGPMIVNTDGTLSRIANWNQMTPKEQENTLRVLKKRNQLRMTSISAEEENSN